MRRFIVSLLTMVMLLGEINSGFSAARVISGEPCKKLGATSVQSGRKFTCIRIGKELKWNTGSPISAISKPSPTPTASSNSNPTPKVASRVSIRIQAPLIERNSDGSPKNFLDLSTSSRGSDWAMYYGSQLNTYLKSLNAGESFDITWLVTDSDLGTPLAGERVWLLVNGNSAGRQLATFSYNLSGQTFIIPANNNTASGETQIEGVTDSHGLVTFRLRNLNSGATADNCCLTQAPNSDFLRAFSNISLTTKRLYTLENRDFLWADFVNREQSQGPEYLLIWSDEFSGSAGSHLNSQYWTSRYCGQDPANGGGTCYNNESQYYVPENVTQDGSIQGNASISTTRVYSTPSNVGRCFNPLNNCSFTSGRFDTQGKVSFLYGKIEARIKMPAGSGNWAAFWALGTNITSNGWPVSGEIDIAEQWRFQNTRNTGAIHYSTGALGCCANHRFEAGENYGEDYSSDYHTYSLIWLPNSISLAVDGKTFFSRSSVSASTSLWPFEKPIFLIFNNAISDLSTNFNSWSGWNNSSMSIDYVRAFSINGVGSVFLAKE